MRSISAFAPGRVELLGNHTDYNQGVVLGAAIDRGLTIVGTSRTEDQITLHSEREGTFELSLGAIAPQSKHAWVNYVLGVAHELRERGIALKGFEARISGNLPAGAGLSSSAALEVAAALFLLATHGKNLPPLEIAKLCQRAEHRFVNVQSGLLDQVCSIFGEQDRAVYFDCRSEEVETVPFPGDFALVIAQSGKTRELRSGLYNRRRDETAKAAAALKVRALRDVTTEQVEQSDLPDLLRRRALHITGENERVKQAIALLAEGNGRGFGELMYVSHESSRINFENSTPELDRLVEIAFRIDGVFGARLTGGGFGGATISLCAKAAAESVAAELKKAAASVFITRASPGAGVL